MKKFISTIITAALMCAFFTFTTTATENIPRYVELEHIIIGFFDDNSKLEFRNSTVINNIRGWGFIDLEMTNTENSNCEWPSGWVGGPSPFSYNESLDFVVARAPHTGLSRYLSDPFAIEFTKEIPSNSTIFTIDVKEERGEVILTGEFVVDLGDGNGIEIPLDITITNAELPVEEEDEDEQEVEDINEDEICLCIACKICENGCLVANCACEDCLDDCDCDTGSNPPAGVVLAVIPMLVAGGVLWLGRKRK